VGRSVRNRLVKPPKEHLRVNRYALTESSLSDCVGGGTIGTWIRTLHYCQFEMREYCVRVGVISLNNGDHWLLGLARL
jgi:hypothetical protein